jgi:hypothetical protein
MRGETDHDRASSKPRMISLMKRLAVAALLVFAAACSSSNAPGAAKRILPEVAIEQLVGPAQLGYPGGLVDIQYEVTVGNQSDEPITLRRIEVSSIGGGAYRLRRESFPFGAKLGAHQQGTIQFWAHSIQSGQIFRGSNEPVTLRAILHFDSPSGPFQKIVMKSLDQFDSGSPH